MQCIYCEPFAGGAGIACRLMVEGAISEAWINDIDPAIYAFWNCVLTATDDLCELIQNTPITIDEWHRQREVQQRTRVSKVALGFSTLFLNRTNRSGILRGGVIGGYKQEGKYPLDCRFNRVDLVRKVQRLATYRDQIHLTCQDARLYIGSVVRKLPEHSLVNIDPPYFDKGPELYTSFYTANDHAALARAIRAIKKPWMLTYDNVPAIRRLYSGLPGTQKSLNYTAQVKKTGVELLILSPQLHAPRTIELDLLPQAA